MGIGFSGTKTDIGFRDTTALDAFGRLRVATPVELFNVQCQYNAEPWKIEVGATGTGVTPTHDANTRMLTVSATAGTGTAFVQSYEYIPYYPGKSQRIECTGVFGAAIAAATLDFGYFDANNGIFLRQNGTTNYQLIRRTSTSGSVSEETVAQSSWNVDKLDGTGPSGLTFDFTKAIILFIDLQYLGMGRVRVGLNIGGCTYIMHEFEHAGVLSVPYMQTAALPVGMVLTATASGSTKTAYFKCASVLTEGGDPGFEPYVFSTPEQTVTAGSGSQTHILSVRPRTTFNTLTNRVHLHVHQLELLVTGINPVYWQLCLGSTFSAGPTWANIDTTNSAMEYTSAVGTLSAAGMVIAAGYCAASASVKSAIGPNIEHSYPLTLDRAGAQRANGTLSLIVTGIGGTSATRALMWTQETR
jgi:hypothetical protein